MTCPNWNCRLSIPNTFDGCDCPTCGCHLFPVRPFDEREFVASRPMKAKEESRGSLDD